MIKRLRHAFYRSLPGRSNLFYRWRRRGLKPRIDRPGVETYSQYGQDLLLSTVLFRGVKNGYFVDIGANDGVTLSNTFLLEKNQGWSGVCVEPQPDIYAKLIANRSCRCIQCCVSTTPGEVDFLQVVGANMLSGMLDSIDGRHRERIRSEVGAESERMIRVPAQRFEDLVPAGTAIDYLSIDTEGAERVILEAIPFDRYPIRVLSVENNYGEPFIHDFLVRRGFHLVVVIGDDEFYVRSGFEVPSFGRIQRALCG